MSNSIKITVKVFAAYQVAYNPPELVLEFPENTPVSQVREYLIKENPELEKWRDVTKFGVNFNFVEPNTPLNDGDEVVLIPPVSGG
ncbi:MAG: MoaD/ThiS family protein [Cyanobacteria bacterium J06641_2]